MKIIWHNKAEVDLNENISFIAKQSTINALNVLDKLIDLTNGLIHFPYKYPKEPIYNKENIRFVSKWSFKIIYRVEKDVIIILRVFNTNQHPSKTKI